MSRLLALLLMLMPVAADARSFYVAGAQGIPLAVTEAGTPGGPEILFLHGLGQGKESFLPQLDAEALRGHHMVAFDLRGHGMSAKPWQEADYTDPVLWAEDVKAVMRATGLKKPVLVAWSYGALVAADYIRHFGTDSLAGLILISSLGGLVEAPPPRPDTAFPAELLRARALVGIPDLALQAEYGALIVPMLSRAGAAKGWHDRAAKLALMVPPYAQPHLRAHPFSNTDLLPKLDIPLLFVHGDFEASFSQATVDQLLAAAPCARASAYTAQGHSPFAEAPTRFNAELVQFVADAPQGCKRPSKATDTNNAAVPNSPQKIRPLNIPQKSPSPHQQPG
jgi:pimeloyl-ACP methyl ester carboxylesterase